MESKRKVKKKTRRMGASFQKPFFAINSKPF